MRFRPVAMVVISAWGAALALACSKGLPIVDDVDGAVAGGVDGGHDASVNPPGPDSATPGQDSSVDPPDSYAPLPDAAPVPDSSVACKAVALGDGGFDASACPVSNNNSVCAPSSVSKYVPKWTAPTSAHQNLCTAAQAQKFYDDCFDPILSSAAACTTFQTNNAACFACVYTLETDPQWGPVVDHGAYASVNVAGCIAVAETCNLPCAKAIQAREGCSSTSCNSVNCPITTQASFTAFNTCVTNADKCLCKGYADVSACQSALADGGAAATVCNGPDFATLFKQVSGLFCGK